MTAWPALSVAIALLVALAVDRWCGEPPVRLHPVVWMGNALGWAGQGVQRRANQRVGSTDYTAFGLAAFTWCALACVVVGLACTVEWLLQGLPWWSAALLTGVLLKPMLAWTMLQSEVQAVELALGTFWFALFGLPGAALYRFANTADAMWGYRGIYKGQNWEWAGKWAARADDVLSWVPARITAVLLLAADGGRGLAQLARLRTEAGQTPSPNSGWPMAAMALNLDVALCKPGVYVLHAPGRAVQAGDMARAIGYAAKAVRYLVTLVSIVLILVATGVPT